MLTIAISIASGADAVFSFLPLTAQGYTLVGIERGDREAAAGLARGEALVGEDAQRLPDGERREPTGVPTGAP